MSVQNIGAVACLFAAALFLVLAAVFALRKERAALLVSGFHTLTKEQQSLYDKNKICLAMQRSLLVWGTVLLVGAALSYFMHVGFAVAAFVLWLVLFFKDVHMEAEKAFEPYRL